MKNMYAHLVNLFEKKKPLVLATIIETKGSSPQIPGASAIFSSKELLLAGTIGGGVLEANAQKKSIQALKKRETLVCDFSLKDDINSDKGAICGGEIKIIIDACPEKYRDTFNSIIKSLNQRKPGILATFINKISKQKVELSRYWIEEKEKFAANLAKHLSLFKEEIEETLLKGKSKLLKINEKISSERIKENFLFLEPIFPLPQLVIFGAGHIGQALAHLGSLLSFEVTVIDDRAEFANKEKFPDTDHIIIKDIGKALQNFPISPDTYFVIVTRGHQYDAEALRQIIKSKAAYIGMIGSKKKIALIRKKILEQKFATDRQFDSIYAPIGIDINSKTVEEIAVSIMGQLILVRSKMKGKR